MTVYLVPVGASRYELYCEVADAAEAVQDDGQDRPGLMQRIRNSFSRVLAEAERHRRGEAGPAPDAGWIARSKAWMLCWIAESIAEQRLLWHLRKQDDACLIYPADLEDVSATDRLRAQLSRDFRKHRFWLVVDGLCFVASGVLVILPGPNALAYYLGFRLFGHYLSLQGASRGLKTVRWTLAASGELAELRAIVTLDPEQRSARLNDLADRLRLQHLAKFVERTAPRPRAA